MANQNLGPLEADNLIFFFRLLHNYFFGQVYLDTSLSLSSKLFNIYLSLSLLAKKANLYKTVN